MPATDPHTVAFMDIGTNSIRLLVVQISPNHSHKILTQLKETVRLGEGEFNEQQLQPDAIDRAVLVAQQFAIMARSFGAVEIIAVATAATREAKNQRIFLRRLERDARIDVHVVSGLEEARLVYLGVVNGLHLDQKQALFVDIGGGSTEVIVGGQEDYSYLNSLKLGAIRLSTRFLSDSTGPISRRTYEQIRDYVRKNASRTLRELREQRTDFVVGSSGTIENLADIAVRMISNRPWQKDDVLTYQQLQRVITYLCSLPLEERRKVPGMNPSRADIIIGGAAVLDTLMDELNLTELRVSDRGLRDGLLVDYLLRMDHTPLVESTSVRYRSVLQLGRTCRFDEDHAMTTARLALALFDSGRELGLHKLGDEQRELLEYAAILHHIGAFLTFSSYQHHTYYLIRNAELLGFDQQEISIIATTALYHRGSLPRRKEPEFGGLSSRDQQIVRTLCMLLRLAENLDRSQASAIREARFEALGGDRIALRLYATQECQVELWGLENQRAAFEKVFGKRLFIEAGPFPVEDGRTVETDERESVLAGR